MKFKPCKGCPTPAQCTAAGKCAKKASGMAYGGMAKKKGYNKGGYCGASNPAERPMKKSS
jgi:hypothetical protein